jgi:hypothetical protein
MLHLLQPVDEESVAIEEIKALGEVVQEVVYLFSERIMMHPQLSCSMTLFVLI